MHKTLGINTKSADRWKVVLLFGSVGVVSASVVLFSFRLGSTAAISAVMGLPFAALILLTARAASSQGWFSFSRSRPANRDWVAGLLFALSHPVGLLLALALSFALTPRGLLPLAEHPEESFSRLEVLQGMVAIPAGFFVGILVSLLICIIAVNVLIGKWPKRSWIWALCISALMAVVLTTPITLGSDHIRLFAWYSVLAAVIGYWICEAAEKSVEA